MILCIGIPTSYGKPSLRSTPAGTWLFSGLPKWAPSQLGYDGSTLVFRSNPTHPSVIKHAEGGNEDGLRLED